MVAGLKSFSVLRKQEKSRWSRFSRELANESVARKSRRLVALTLTKSVKPSDPCVEMPNVRNAMNLLGQQYIYIYVYTYILPRNSARSMENADA